MKIGFDLDGVILDNTSFKVESFKEIFGMDLENWQVSSNIIDDFVPDKEVRRHVGKLSGTRSASAFIDDSCIQLFKKLKAKNYQLFIISRRGKSIEGQMAAHKSIEELGIKDLFDSVILCEDEDIKNRSIIENEIEIFVDDRIDVIEKLQDRIALPLLFDNFKLLKAGKIKSDCDLKCVESFNELEKEIENYERSKLL